MSICPKDSGFILFKVRHTFIKVNLYFLERCVCCISNWSLCFKGRVLCVWLCASSPCEVSFTGLILFTLCVCLSSASCSSATSELPGCSTWHYRVALSLLHISSINKRLHKSSAHHRLQWSAPVLHAHRWSECLNPPTPYHTQAANWLLKPAEYARRWSVRERTTQINDISIN